MSQFSLRQFPPQPAVSFFPLTGEKFFSPAPFKHFDEISPLQWQLAALPGCPASLVVVVKESSEAFVLELLGLFDRHFDMKGAGQKPSELKDIQAYVARLNNNPASRELEDLLQKPAMESPPAAPSKMLADIHAVIEKNLDREDFRVADLAKALNYCVMQLHRIIKSLTGHSTACYIRHYRLQKSRELLKNSNHNVSQVAYMTGFHSPEQFARSFRKEFGECPSQCRGRN